MAVEIRQNERLDDLGNGLAIIQRVDAYCFTSDSVLLANIVKVNRKSVVVDLCSGSGIVGILVNAKNHPKNTYCVELQEYMCDICRRSIEYNRLENISVVNADANDCHNILGREFADIVTANPPYYRLNEGNISDNEMISLCRHELRLDLKQLVTSANNLLKYGGRFYVVYRADRLAELIYELTSAKLEPKEIVAVKPTANKEVDTVLVVAKKGAEKGVRVNSVLRSEIESDYSILKKLIK